MLLPIKTPRCSSLVQASPLSARSPFLVPCSSSSCECSIQDWIWDFLLSTSAILLVIPNSLEAQTSTCFQIRNLEVMLESSLPLCSSLPLPLSLPSPANLLVLSVLPIGSSPVAHFGLLLFPLFFLAISSLYHSYCLLTCLYIPSRLSIAHSPHRGIFFQNANLTRSLKTFQGCPVVSPSLTPPQAASQTLSTLPPAPQPHWLLWSLSTVTTRLCPCSSLYDLPGFST